MNRRNHPRVWLLLLWSLACLPPHVLAQAKPNIVLVFMDNFGWGEPGFNGGGIIRGAATPRLEQLAREGLRLTNFNVEVQCTPSRAALMTGVTQSGAAMPPCPWARGSTAWCSGKSRWRKCSPRPATPPGCMGNGTSAARRGGSRPTKASTSGMASPTPPMSQCMPLCRSLRRGG